MSEAILVREILEQICEAIHKVQRRFKPIDTPDDFLNTDIGLDLLDSICMMLIAIGESIKKIDKITKGQLLPRYPEIDWKGVMGIRDIISHHYFDIDAEEIYEICSKEIDPLILTIQKILSANE